MEFLASVFAPSTSSAKKEDTKAPEYKTEFHQIGYEFVKDLEAFRDKYPLISVIVTLVGGFFGLMNIFSFSPTNILTGVFLLTLSVSMGTCIVRKGFSFFSELKNSIWCVLTIYTAVNKAEAKSAEKAN